MHEIEEVIKKLKNGKSTGGSWISAEILKGYSDCKLVELITRMFNLFRVEGLPASWNELLIVSVHKKGALDNPNNFRGIALMPVLAKMYA